MARKRGSTITITREVTIEAEIEVEVSGRKTAAYFSKSFGNWLPGEDPEVDIVEVRIAGVPVDIDAALTKEDIAAVEAEALEQAAEDDAGRADDAADSRYEEMRDRMYERE